MRENVIRVFNVLLASHWQPPQTLFLCLSLYRIFVISRNNMLRHYSEEMTIVVNERSAAHEFRNHIG